jgi:hypothetical protein
MLSPPDKKGLSDTPLRQDLTAPPLARHRVPPAGDESSAEHSADTRSPCEFLFAVRALHAGKGRRVPGGLDFDEFAVESAGDLAGLIIDRMDRPVWHVVTAFSRSDGVGPNAMAAFGARLPRHVANRRRANAHQPARPAPERATCGGV